MQLSSVKQFAIDEGLPVLQPHRARGAEFLSQVRELGADISVVVAFGQILPPEVLYAPRFGSINLHASLLPELRGAAPIQWGDHSRRRAKRRQHHADGGGLGQRPGHPAGAGADPGG